MNSGSIGKGWRGGAYILLEGFRGDLLLGGECVLLDCLGLLQLGLVKSSDGGNIRLVRHCGSINAANRSDTMVYEGIDTNDKHGTASNHGDQQRPTCKEEASGLQVKGVT